MNCILSIIVPVHNTAKYLTKCMDSLVNQTLQNIEIIIVDDASSEDINEVLNKYLSKYPIRIYRNKVTLGPGGARNVGMKNASGKYISFCDSDDWVDITCFEHACFAMEEYNGDIGMIGMVREYDNFMPAPVYKCKYDCLIPLDRDMAFRILTYEYNMGIKIIPANTNKIYRSSYLKKNNFFYKEDTYFEDILFSVQTILNTDNILCIPDELYHHYKRSDSIVQSFTPKHIYDYTNIFENIISFLKESNLYEKYQKNYFRLAEHFYNLIVRQIFEYIHDENERKKYLLLSFEGVEKVINLTEYIKFINTEEIRNHIQPYINDTTIY